MIFKTSDSTYMKSSLSLLSLKLPERDFLTQYFYQGKKKYLLIMNVSVLSNT